jgi:hypothetical protein
MWQYLRIIEYGNNIYGKIKKKTLIKKIILFQFFCVPASSKKIYRLNYIKPVI